MATGACGINCDVCSLNARGICSTCGPGRSREAKEKISAQFRLLGSPCRVLECAIERKIDFCPRDCDLFPCEIFTAASYPYSMGYLNMQERRRAEKPELITPSGEQVEVPTQFWTDLTNMDIKRVCENAGVREYAPQGILIPFLGEFILLDHKARTIYRQGMNKWDEIRNPLLELICLVYLLNAGPELVRGEMVSEKDLRGGHFFTGPHELRKEPILARYGSDIEGFKSAAEKIGGVAFGQADAAYKFLALPKVPVYYLLWEGDEEFGPSLSILFDRSIEFHLAPDAIWGLVNLVSEALMTGRTVA